MKLVIEISESDYKSIKKLGYVPVEWSKDIADDIINGKPLPKGHGDLKDSIILSARVFGACMDSHFMPTKFLGCDTITEIIDNSPTIIEADKEVEE